MKRKARHQTGTVFQQKRDGKLVWFGQYKDASGQRHTDPLVGAKTKSEAKTLLAAILLPVNQARALDDRDPNISLALYTEKIYIPFAKNNWKGSTATDTPTRLKKHIVNGTMGVIPVVKLDRETMQEFLNTYSDKSESFVGHLRFDLRAIMELAVADGYATRNQAKVLHTPRTCKKTGRLPSLTFEQIHQALGVLDIRERVFCRIAIFSGLRPGEIEALKWGSFDGKMACVTERIYKGKTDIPKNNKDRESSLSDDTIADLILWRQLCGDSEYVFPSEKGTTAIWYYNLWHRKIQPRFRKIGLEWADFRCMRRTNARLSKAAGGDVKVGADQRGHNVGVANNEYLESTREEKNQAVLELERMFKLCAPQDQVTPTNRISARATVVQSS